MHLKTLATYLHLPCPHDVTLTGITLDSRRLNPGELFVALKGDLIDGHDFILKAQEKGAAAILASQLTPHCVIPQLIVPDPLKALAQMAAAHRQTTSIPLIALTGSNGKTSVKEMIHGILPPPSLATQGNLNNHLGVPLTLLRLTPEHRYAVLELGASHVGEIAYTAALARPSVALVNNIGPAHIGEFGSLEAIAQTKGEIYAALSPTGTAVLNLDEPFSSQWKALLPTHSILTFSREHPADIYATDIHLTPTGCASFILHTPSWKAPLTLRIPGQHALSNALAATACCLAVGISQHNIVQGLMNFQGVSGRQTFLTGLHGATLIDDTYNANLHSVLAAIDVLAARPGKRILVLGDIGELGDYAQEHHETIGLAAKAKHLDALFTCGTATEATSTCFGAHAYHFHTQAELIHALLPHLNAHTTVLIKGSRFMAMEHIVEALLESAPTEG